ncbi:MAG: CobW family GTP-binding protein [Betaproteobacteria bacterium]
MTAPKIPVTVLTGFLGAGKTTLLNRILSENHGRRIAVVENEFGEIGVDQDLVIRADEEVFEMNNGCICCTVRGDLIRILGSLMKRRDRFDRILIETTGLADPGPVAQTFFVDDDMREAMSLDAVVTVVDARHLGQHLDTSDEARSQVAFADVILLNKMDLVTPAEADALEARLRGMNGMARVRRVHMAQAPMEDVLDIGGFDIERALSIKPTFLDPEYPFEWVGAVDIPSDGALLRLAQGPDPSMRVLCARLLPGETLEEAAERILPAFSGPAAACSIGASVSPDGRPVVLDLGGHAASSFQLQGEGGGRFGLFTEHLPEEFDLALQTAAGTPLPPAEQRRFAAAHEHDAAVTSVGIEFRGALDSGRVNTWLSKLLQTRGADIYRMKGLLDIAGESERFVFQGVHMLFDGQPGGGWGTDGRVNRLVFIGRGLDREELESGLRSCLVRQA